MQQPYEVHATILMERKKLKPREVTELAQSQKARARVETRQCGPKSWAVHKRTTHCTAEHDWSNLYVRAISLFGCGGLFRFGWDGVREIVGYYCLNLSLFFLLILLLTFYVILYKTLLYIFSKLLLQSTAHLYLLFMVALVWKFVMSSGKWDLNGWKPGGEKKEWSWRVQKWQDFVKLPTSLAL